MAKPQIAQLRVKVKSLAQEARDIRLEERRAKGRRKREKDGKVIPGEFRFRDDALRLSLRSHRTNEVRNEQRAALLAYAFVRGVPYHKVEPLVDWSRYGWEATKRRDELWERVRSLVKKFGDPDAFKSGGTDEATRTAALAEGLRAWERAPVGTAAAQ